MTNKREGGACESYMYILVLYTYLYGCVYFSAKGSLTIQDEDKNLITVTAHRPDYWPDRSSVTI